jgi:hypothetical protein
MTDTPPPGIDVSGLVIVPHELEQEIEAAGIELPHGLTVAGPAQPAPDPTVVPDPNPTPQPLPEGSYLFTYDDQGNPTDLPPGAEDVVRNYTYTAQESPALVRSRLLARVRGASTVQDLRDAVLPLLA